MRLAAATCIVALVSAGCSTEPRHAVITVRPGSSTVTQAVSTRISGLAAGEVYTVALSSVDSQHTHWVSSARFRAGRTGVIDVDRATSLGGSYTGVHPMGLVEALTPSPAVTDEPVYSQSGRQSFDLRVSTGAGQTVGRATFHRDSAPNTGTSTQSVSHEGFDGVYFAATHAAQPHPAILAFGGSEGGNAIGPLGKALAGAGYSTLTLAYFHAPGLPKDLVKIPLEYFVRALRWLRAQPDVDPRHIYILGISRGSEAAQLLAVHYPKLLYGVILGVPSNTVNAGLTGGTGGAAQEKDASAWTLHGRQLPYTLVVASTERAAAVIPDASIRGPVFITCGDADKVWPSCPMSQAIADDLETRDQPSTSVLAAYADAGHGVGQFVPYEPTPWTPTSWRGGHSRLSTQAALAQVWPSLLSFLAATSRH